MSKDVEFVSIRQKNLRTAHIFILSGSLNKERIMCLKLTQLVVLNDCICQVSAMSQILISWTILCSKGN